MLPRACDVKRSICTGSLPLIVAKPIKPLMMVVQRSIRAFSAEILGSRRRERLRGGNDARYGV